MYGITAEEIRQARLRRGLFRSPHHHRQRGRRPRGLRRPGAMAFAPSSPFRSTCRSSWRSWTAPACAPRYRSAFPAAARPRTSSAPRPKRAWKHGATDLDMVMNIAAFKAGDYKSVADDIAAVRAVAKPYGVPFKVIIEIGALTDAEIVTARQAGGRQRRRLRQDLHRLRPRQRHRARHHASSRRRWHRIGIKASGGVASIEDGVSFMRAGASIVALRHMLVDQLEAIGWKK